MLKTYKEFGPVQHLLHSPEENVEEEDTKPVKINVLRAIPPKVLWTPPQEIVLEKKGEKGFYTIPITDYHFLHEIRVEITLPAISILEKFKPTAQIRLIKNAAHNIITNSTLSHKKDILAHTDRVSSDDKLQHNTLNREIYLSMIGESNREWCTDMPSRTLVYPLYNFYSNHRGSDIGTSILLFKCTEPLELKLKTLKTPPVEFRFSRGSTYDYLSGVNIPSSITKGSIKYKVVAVVSKTYTKAIDWINEKTRYVVHKEVVVVSDQQLHKPSGTIIERIPSPTSTVGISWLAQSTKSVEKNIFSNYTTDWKGKDGINPFENFSIGIPKKDEELTSIDIASKFYPWKMGYSMPFEPGYNIYPFGLNMYSKKIDSGIFAPNTLITNLLGEKSHDLEIKDLEDSVSEAKSLDEEPPHPLEDLYPGKESKLDIKREFPDSYYFYLLIHQQYIIEYGKDKSITVHRTQESLKNIMKDYIDSTF